MTAACKITVTAGDVPSAKDLFNNLGAFNPQTKRLEFSVEFTTTCTGKCPVEHTCPDEVTESVPCSLNLRSLLNSPAGHAFKRMWRFATKPGNGPNTQMGNGKTVRENWAGAVAALLAVAGPLISGKIADQVKEAKDSLVSSANCDCELVSGVANNATREGYLAYAKKAVKSRHY